MRSIRYPNPKPFKPSLTLTLERRRRGEGGGWRSSRSSAAAVRRRRWRRAAAAMAAASQQEAGGAPLRVSSELGWMTDDGRARPWGLRSHRIRGRCAYMQHLDKLYKQHDISWFTPVELFKPWYAHGIAQAIMRTANLSVPLKDVLPTHYLWKSPPPIKTRPAGHPPPTASDLPWPPINTRPAGWPPTSHREDLLWPPIKMRLAGHSPPKLILAGLLLPKYFIFYGYKGTA